MGQVQRAYRLDEELIERIDRWAFDHKVTQTEAVRRLLAAGLDSDEVRTDSEKDAEVRRLSSLEKELRAQIEELRSDKAFYISQMAEKDEQIRAANKLADHAQVLQLASVQKQLTDGTDESEGTEDQTATATAATVIDDEPEKTSWRARLARWIRGEE